MMKRLIATTVFAGALALPMFAGTAFAGHDHNLITPGGHKFHANVHFGRPGKFAFEQPNNRVSVARVGADPCVP